MVCDSAADQCWSPMCGVAGLLAKTPAARERLGADLAAMVGRLADRGPDSAGFALFDEPPEGGGAVLTVARQVGPPTDLIESSGLAAMSGSHAIAHTRMATESRVSTAHSHPFCPAPGLALVHNGSLSNHNDLRRRLARLGVGFETDNDSEVAARFVAWRLDQGDDLEAALEAGLEQLDGFFTFLVADADGIVVVRDRFACKPALVAETADWVAIASERAAISRLPGGEEAEAWEPEPARIYSFTRLGVPA